MLASCAICGLEFAARRRSARYCSGACRSRRYRDAKRGEALSSRHANRVEVGRGWELRNGLYQDVLRDVECDALIVDPPYSARAHSGHDSVAAGARDGRPRRRLSYAAWTESDVRAFVSFWSPRTRGWLCAMSCSELAPVWRAELETAGRYAFAPVPCVIRGMTVRLSGDGPSSWSVALIAARPRTRAFSRWGTLRGAYVTGRGKAGRIGGKPLELMREIVGDYSREGDIIVDPCAGYGTTGAAAIHLGRRFIGAEVDSETHTQAVLRLRAAVQAARGKSA